MDAENNKTTEYAGWSMAEARLSGLLKLAYLAVGGGALTYFLVCLYGQGGRGPLSGALQAATAASASLMYAIVLLVVIFGVVVIASSFEKPRK